MFQNSNFVKNWDSRPHSKRGPTFFKIFLRVCKNPNLVENRDSRCSGPEQNNNNNNNNNNNKKKTKEISRSHPHLTCSPTPNSPPPHNFSSRFLFSPVALPYSLYFIFCHLPAAHIFTPSHSFGHSHSLSLSLIG